MRDVPEATERGSPSVISRGGLRRRLMLFFLLLALTPIALSNAIGYLRSESIIEQLVQRYLDGIAELEAVHVSEQLERHTRYLQEMARDGVLEALTDRHLEKLPTDGAFQTAVEALLMGRMDAYPAFEALYLYDADGVILASVPLPPADLVLWMEPPLGPQDQPVAIVRDADPPHAPQLRLAVPAGPGNPPAVYVGGAIEVVGTPEFLQLPEHTAGSVESFVVDERGVPLFISHPHGHLDYSIALTTPLLSGEEGRTAAYADRLGIEVIGTIVPVPGRPWRLITEVPVEDALLELRALRRVSLWLAAFLAVIVAASAWWMAGRVVAPVRSLLGATRRLGTGDLETRVTIDTGDEIGELGAAFNDMAEDLSDKSARVEELHQREMERAGQLATVGELASGLAHEIKNPLAGISGGVDLVIKHTRENEHLGPITDEMKKQVARMEGAVRDLMAFARPAEPVYALADLGEIVERALTLVRPAASKAGVEIEVLTGRELPAVRVDPEMIRGCLVNLIVNAVQASQAGGRVRVESTPQEGWVSVTIADDGVGIPPEQLSQIFKPFYTTKHRGTGLGLSITRGMIERHGGTISVTSEPGVGTTFELRLPPSGDAETGAGDDG